MSYFNKPLLFWLSFAFDWTQVLKVTFGNDLRFRNKPSTGPCPSQQFLLCVLLPSWGSQSTRSMFSLRCTCLLLLSISEFGHWAWHSRPRADPKTQAVSPPQAHQLPTSAGVYTLRNQPPTTFPHIWRAGTRHKSAQVCVLNSYRMLTFYFIWNLKNIQFV